MAIKKVPKIPANKPFKIKGIKAKSVSVKVGSARGGKLGKVRTHETGHL